MVPHASSEMLSIGEQRNAVLDRSTHPGVPLRRRDLKEHMYQGRGQTCVRKLMYTDQRSDNDQTVGVLARFQNADGELRT